MTFATSSDDWKHQTASLRRLARALVGDCPDAEDLVQEALLAGWQRTGEPVSVGWLRSVVRSRAIDLRRRLGRRGAVLAVDPETADTGVARPEAIAEHLEIQQALLQGMRELAPRYRDALYLRYFEDLGPTEIASRLDVPVKTIKSQISRGLERLHARLGEDRDPGEQGRANLRLGLVLFATGSPLAGPVPPWALTGAATAAFSMKLFLAAVAVVLACIAGFLLMAERAAPTEIGIQALAAAENLVGPVDRIEEIDATVNVTGSSGRASVASSKTGPSGERGSAPEQSETLAADSALASGALVVHVTWHDGTNAEGVTLVTESAAASGASPVRHRGVTDGAGSARIAGLAPGAYAVSVDRGARWTPPVLVDVVANFDQPLYVRLERGVDVIGTVRNGDGVPVRGAGVWLTSATLDWTGGRIVARTDSAGGFRLRDVPSTRSLGAIVEGFAPSDLVDLDLAEVKDDATQIELVVSQPGGALSGRVIDDFGQPVPGAIVATSRGTTPFRLRPNLKLQEFWTPRTGITRDDGTFRIEALAPGLQEVHVRSTGGPIWSGECFLVGGETSALEITLARAGTVTGVVQDADGVPVPGALVALDPGEPQTLTDGPGGSPFALPCTVSGEDGRFVLGQVAPGALALRAELPGTPAAARARLSVEAGGTVTWNPVLDEGRVISGTLLYADRSPVEQGYIDASEVGGADKASTHSTDGAFRLDGLRGEAYDLTLSTFEPLAEGRTLRLAGVRPSTEPLEWILDVDPPVVTEPCVVRFRFDDRGNRAGAGAGLAVMLQSRGTGIGWIGRRADESNGWLINIQRAGTFTPLVHAGSRVIASGEPVVLDGSGDVDLGTIRSVPGAAFVIEIARPPALKESRVTLEVLVAASVTPEIVDLGSASTYRLDNVEPGRVRLRLRGADFVSLERTVEVAEGAQSDVALELLPAVPVTCTVLRGPESLNEVVQVSVLAATGGKALWSDELEDSRGASNPWTFTLNVPVGSSTILVESGDRGTARKTVDIPALGAVMVPVSFDLR